MEGKIMTPEQQRIAIAEACGFTKEEPWLDGRDCWSHKDSPMHVGFEEVPDFLNDLNAMHEAWQLLTHEQKLAYRREIALIASREVPNRQSHWLEDIAAEFGHEAYLRTIGKWIE
jgi:hypothetical protein